MFSSWRRTGFNRRPRTRETHGRTNGRDGERSTYRHASWRSQMITNILALLTFVMVTGTITGRRFEDSGEDPSRRELTPKTYGVWFDVQSAFSIPVSWRRPEDTRTRRHVPNGRQIEVRPRHQKTSASRDHPPSQVDKPPRKRGSL